MAAEVIRVRGAGSEWTWALHLVAADGGRAQLDIGEGFATQDEALAAGQEKHPHVSEVDIP